MTWFKKIMPSRIKTGRRKRSVPEGVWLKCAGCAAMLYRPEVERQLWVCPKCGHHMPMRARDRLEKFLDPGSWQELAATLEPEDPLRFRDTKRYRDRLAQAQKTTHERDALIVLAGTVCGLEVVACALEFDFIAGTLGSVVGERFVRAVDYCVQHRSPLVCFTSSGGARLQEGLFSLLQMAKTSAALTRLARARLPYISVLAHPTTGGVAASIGMLGDIEIGEPQALIGFAGPRVIQQTTGETLPPGFQRAETSLEHGALDMILDRRELRERIARMLSLLLNRPAPLGA
jgi:acetyl-CoA carboxylase carboxyl transferase subunit beta